jgi:hypothetical protein
MHKQWERRNGEERKGSEKRNAIAKTMAKG